MVKVDLSGAEKFFTGAGPDYALAALTSQVIAGQQDEEKEADDGGHPAGD